MTVMERFITLAVRALMAPLSVRRARRLAQRAVDGEMRLPQGGDGPVPVAAMQVELRSYRGLGEYVGDMHGYVREAAERGARLMAFPELCAMTPALALPLSGMLFRRGKNGGKGARDAGPEPEGGHPAPSERTAWLFAALVRGAWRPAAVHLAVMSVFARAYGVVIMAGSGYVFENGRVYNRAFLIDAEGRTAGRQDKAHPVVLELGLGVAPGERISVFNAGVCRLSMPVCMDATYFETFKICKGLGAQVVIIPIADMAEYNESLALRGIEPRVQEEGVYGVRSALVGRIAGIPFTGRAGIFAPVFTGQGRRGVVALAGSWDRREVVAAALDLSLLKSRSDPYGSDVNEEFSRWACSLYRPGGEGG